MLENVIKHVKNLVALSLIGLMGFGCATYKTFPPGLVPLVEQELEKSLETPINYSNLNWQEAIRYVQTPEQAQDYLDTYFTYDYTEIGFAIPGFLSIGCKGETFKYNHSRRKGNCFDYATVAASLLSDDGFLPLVMVMKENIFSGHAVFLYKTKNSFGALGSTPVKPEHFTIDNLIKHINKENKMHFNEYVIINFDENFKNKTWISRDIDLRKKVPIFEGYTKVK